LFYGLAMSETGGRHLIDPTAAAMTTDVARAGRSEAEWAFIRNLAESRERWRGILEAPPSPARTRIISAAFESTYRAYGRRDWEFNTLSIHPTDYVFRGGDMHRLIPGTPADARGVTGYLEMHRAFLEAWTDAEVRFDGVLEAPDGRLVGLPRFVLRGGSSGLELDHALADVHVWREGWLVEQTYWLDRDAGLRAVGIDPAALAASDG
jgi:hypothetical protein